MSFHRGATSDQSGLDVEIAQLLTMAPVELRKAVVDYLGRAAVLDRFERLLDQT